MITSKITSKAQTTIPQPVRAALRLKIGDELVYQIRGAPSHSHESTPAHSASGIPRPIEKRMGIFSQGDVVKVPFPYTDRPTRQSRPALVVSTGLEDAHNLIWVVMITSAENRGSPGDVAITSLPDAGLPAPSVIRAVKIATIDAMDGTKLGKIGAQLRKVIARIGR